MTTTEPEIFVKCEKGLDAFDPAVFCQMHITLGEKIIGDQSAWSVAGLLLAAISELEEMLPQQKMLSEHMRDYMCRLSPPDLFQALYSWQWKSGIWLYEDICPLAQANVRLFNALPLGSEIFDGENAYIVWTGGRLGRFLWRDFDTHQICEQVVDFDRYLNIWTNAKKV